MGVGMVTVTGGGSVQAEKDMTGIKNQTTYRAIIVTSEVSTASAVPLRKKRYRVMTASEFDRLFDEGQDITPLLDLARARRGTNPQPAAGHDVPEFDQTVSTSAAPDVEARTNPSTRSK